MHFKKNDLHCFIKIECGVLELRSTCVFLLPFIFLVLKSLNGHLYGGNDSLKRSISQLLFPPLMFFSFFYYTDNGSLALGMVFKGNIFFLIFIKHHISPYLLENFEYFVILVSVITETILHIGHCRDF